jgi:type VI protein secretion system component Hcp
MEPDEWTENRREAIWNDLADAFFIGTPVCRKRVAALDTALLEDIFFNDLVCYCAPLMRSLTDAMIHGLFDEDITAIRALKARNRQSRLSGFWHRLKVTYYRWTYRKAWGGFVSGLVSKDWEKELQDLERAAQNLVATKQPVQRFLKIEGIPGECADEAHPGWIELESFFLMEGMTRQAVKIKGWDGMITKRVDGASSRLMELADANQPLEQAIVEIYGNRELNERIRLGHVVLSDYERKETEQGLTERFSFLAKTAEKTGDRKGRACASSLNENGENND